MADLGNDVCEVGDEVVLIGRQGDERITADEIAASIETINYEIVTRISSRIPRIYRG
jgi:alanine racemase